MTLPIESNLVRWTMTSEDLDKWIGCDQCGSAQALYLVKLIEGELAFCGHHYNKNKEALDKKAFEIIQLNKTEETPVIEKEEV